jgi:uncharacterized protein
MNPRPPFRIAGAEIAPGSRATIDLPVAQLYTHTPLTMPIQVVHGRREGPRLLVCAAIHGDEINGVEIIRRLLKQAALKRLAGTLIAVPIVNVFGFIDRVRYLPDRRDLNRSFPGTEQGSLAGRIAWLFKTEVLDRATHVIDLHTAAIHRANMPQIRVNLSDQGSYELAKAFGVPLIINSGLIDGSLRSAADALGIPVVTYESGEALRFDEPGIKAGLHGILSVMRHLNMLPAAKTRPRARAHYVANSSSWVRAGQDGIFRAVVGLGARVEKAQVLGYIADPFGEREMTVQAQFSGLVIGRANLPLVHEGEALFNIARFDAVGRVVQQVEAFTQRMEDEDEAWAEEPPIV